MAKKRSERQRQKMYEKICHQAKRIGQLETAIRNAEFTVPPEQDKRNKKRRAFAQMVAEVSR